MAPRGGYTSPENMRIILDVVKYLRASGFIIDAGRGNSQFLPPQSPIGIRNDTGVEIPAFGCVQCSGTVEAGGNNWIKVVKPVDTTGAAGGYLFNGIAPVEIDGYGIAHDGPECRMLTDGSAIVCGASWQPTIGSFEIKPGGSTFSVIGSDDIETDVVRAITKWPGGVVMKSPGGGIAARSGTTISSATCTEWTRSGTTLSAGTATYTVYNLSATAVAATVFIVAVQTNIGWVAVWEDC